MAERPGGWLMRQPRFISRPHEQEPTTKRLSAAMLAATGRHFQ
jgi:hypothetical protein